MLSVRGQIGLGLLNRCLCLDERGLGLGDLMIEFRRGNLDEQLPFLDAIAYIDIALLDIAAGTRKQVGDRKAEGGGERS
jgi:hypothetical protein